MLTEQIVNDVKRSTLDGVEIAYATKTLETFHTLNARHLESVGVLILGDDLCEAVDVLWLK